MAHKEQKQFCKLVKKLHPSYFRRVNVVDVGSLDINGNNRYLFSRSNYKGIDVYAGKNVDMVGTAHEMLPKAVGDLSIEVNSRYSRRTAGAVLFDTIISTECLEHDKYFALSLQAMYECLNHNGLLLITAAGEYRAEHGTTEHHAWTSPGTNDFYRNVTNEMFIEVLPPQLFTAYFINQNKRNFDFQFFWIKK